MHHVQLSVVNPIGETDILVMLGVSYSQLMLRCHSEVRSACWTSGLLVEHLNILPRWFMLGVKWRML